VRFLKKKKNESFKKSQSIPKISIITSVFAADKFIASFLCDIVQQTVFEQCELILINAHSSGHEEQVIFEYMKRYSNIIYVKLGYDPGLYGVWNIGIKLARGIYITNANVDDRVRHDCYELHANMLDSDSTIDLVYSDIYVTYKPNETLIKHSAREVQESAEFSIQNMYNALPNDHPMWRKDMHQKYGLFDDKYISAGDYEMWIRAVAGGAKFKKVHGVLGLHYVNPNGLSTSVGNSAISAKEAQEIRAKYQFLWNK